MLQNHVLFHIAEEPPAEMASLVNYGTVSAVVKRRAKELLSVVREAVKRGLNLTKDQEEQVVRTRAEPRKDVTMLENEMKSLEMGGLSKSGVILPPLLAPESHLPLSASHSSLFGPLGSLQPSVSASTSTLFGAVNIGSTRNQVRISIPHELTLKLHPL